MKRFRKNTRLFAFILLACILVRTNICEQKMGTYTETYGDSSHLSAISVPHGLHYSYLENDTQRFLYDMMYKVGTPQTVGTAQEVIFYNIGEVPTKYYYPADENDYCFAREALRYDNPDKIEYSLYEYHLKYLKNTSNTYDAYLCADPVENYDYRAMNAQMKAAVENVINSAKEKGLINLTTEESTVMSLFKLALYLHPVKPDYNNYFKDADDYEWWGITYDWNAVRNPGDEYPRTAYAALVDKSAVCVGTSAAYLYVLKELGIDNCLCVEGMYGTQHVWNIVKIENEWYAVDTTNMVITGGEFANNEKNKTRKSDLFGYSLPTANGAKYIGTELGEKYIAERAEKYGFRQGSPSQENGNGSTSEDPSNSSSGSTTTTETPSNNGSEGNSSSKSESSSSNAGSTTESSSNSGNNNTAQPSNPSSSDDSNSNTNAGTSTSTPASTPSSNENENAPGSVSNNDSNSTSAQRPTENSESASTKPSSNDTSASVAPSIPKSVSAKVSKKTVTVKWKKQTKNTTGYEIQYSTDKKFKKNLKTVTAKKTSTKTTIKKLKAKKTYYIRIRTVCKQNGKNVYSKWSKVQKVKIK